MPMHIELQPMVKDIILTDENTHSRVVISSYQKDERMWVAVDAPKHISIEHLAITKEEPNGLAR